MTAIIPAPQPAHSSQSPHPSAQHVGSVSTTPHYTIAWQSKHGLWAILRDGHPCIWLEPEQHHLAYHIIKILEA